MELNKSKIAEIVENKSKEIFDLLNKDEESEISNFDENMKVNPKEDSFLDKGSIFGDLNESHKIKLGTNMSSISPQKTMKKPKKKKEDEFEYCIEEDVLSYQSSLHSAFPK